MKCKPDVTRILSNGDIAPNDHYFYRLEEPIL